MSVKTCGSNRKNISENIVKLKLEQNIKSLLYNNLVYYVERNRIFDNCMRSPPDKTENTFHS